MSDDSGDVYVCTHCIDERALKDLLVGKRRECDFCSASAISYSVDDIANEVHKVIEEDFFLTPSEPEGLDYALAQAGRWERSGEEVLQIICDIAGTSEEIGRTIREHLSDRYDHHAVKGGDEAPYSNEALYEPKGIDDWNFRESWDSFKSNIKTRSRYFSLGTQRTLDEIFDGVGTLKTARGQSAIRQVTPKSSSRYFFRARVCFSDRDLKKVLANPATELGPPPSQSARAGRMNPTGISVFYGAMNRATCIAEIRAPVGSHVVVGRFEPIRPISILDFDVLQKSYVAGSYFDPAYKLRSARATFLKRLAQEIARPVMPHEEEIEYLPTQLVSEYLAERITPRLDGIVFRSSQTGGSGRNVVLFNHSCRVEPYELPKDSEIDISMGSYDEDGFDDSITIFEQVPKETKAEEKVTKKQTCSAQDDLLALVVKELNMDAELDESPYIAVDDRKPTLKLDIASIRVLPIQSIKYKHRDRSISRYRREKDAPTKF